LVSTSVIRRWAKRFPTGLHAHQPVAPFRSTLFAGGLEFFVRTNLHY